MAKDVDWREDNEAFGIAMKLLDKFPKIFEGLDLTKIKFVRKLGGNSTRVGEIKSCLFPFDIDSPYAYYIVIDNARWKEMSEAQRVLTVMHFIYSVAPGGTDESSKNYAHCRVHDVKDYDCVLAAAGGRYDWCNIGVTDVNNPLTMNEDALMARMEEAR